LISILLLTGLIPLAFGQTPPPYIPESGLIGWWPFNGNANDESGNNLHGIVNGATLCNDRNGMAGKAYDFDGINDFISAPRQAMNSLTVSMWFNANYIPVVTPLLDAYDSNWELLLRYYNACVVKWEGTPAQYQYLVSYDQDIFENTWYHFVFSYTNNNVNIYINGDWGLTLSGISFNSSNGLYYFGASISGTAQYLYGQIDDVAIWNRALSQNEITRLYKACELHFQTQPLNQAVVLNHDALFIATSSDPSASYQWQTDLGVGYVNLNNVSQYQGVTNDSLKITSVNMVNNNQPFRCIITTDSCSDTSDIAVLTISSGISDLALKYNVKIFPNPANNQVNISFDAILKGSDYSISTVDGRILKTGKLESMMNTIDLSELKDGQYILIIQGGIQKLIQVIHP
jgi:hypothetical protein